MQHRRLIAYADFACPFCREAESVNDRLRQHGVTVTDAALELRPPGVPLPKRGVRTRKAHEAAAHARAEGRHADMRAALFEAYWGAGRDIGRIDVLTEIGREIGLDASALRVALDIDKWTDAVEEDERRAALWGLTGVPAWVLLDGDGDAPAGVKTGLREFEELRAWVERDDI